MEVMRRSLHNIYIYIYKMRLQELLINCISPMEEREGSGKTPSFLVLKLNFFFLKLHLQHMVVPRLGVELELQLLAYTTATVVQDLSHL